MTSCLAEECGHKRLAGDYCGRHYAQWKRHGRILPRTLHDPNEIEIREGHAAIILYDKNMNKKAEALIDIADVPLCRQFKWGKPQRYVTTRINGKTTPLQNFLFGGGVKWVDHINLDPLDNRRANLRQASPSDNLANRGLDGKNTSGFKGVSFCKKTNKWDAQIAKSGVHYNLGKFQSARNAAYFYNEAARKYHGEFARYNKLF